MFMMRRIHSEENCNSKDLNLDPVTEAEDDKQQLHGFDHKPLQLYTRADWPSAFLKNGKSTCQNSSKVLPEEYRKALIRPEEEEKLTDLTE